MMRLLALVLVGLGARLGDELGERVTTRRFDEVLPMRLDDLDQLVALFDGHSAFMPDAIGTSTAPQEGDKDPRTDHKRPAPTVEDPATGRAVVERDQDGPEGERKKHAANQDVHGRFRLL